MDELLLQGNNVADTKQGPEEDIHQGLIDNEHTKQFSNTCDNDVLN